ncbi:MAG TPA: sulfate permease [Tepidisphaeraceae bacterium]|nr:sulfate permease [Tepidisphaeraceae bacterium]
MSQLNAVPPLPAGQSPAAPASVLHRFDRYLPKTLVCLREGYGRAFFWNDLAAGLTVGVIALPLAMAFAINSGPGLKPEMGLYTAIVAGFLVSLLGGSRVSIAGPTGAFMPILYAIVAKHGYEGLAIATIMAGVILIIMGVARLGSMIKFIPYPVTTGFTAGIAVIIFTSQMKDLFGLTMGDPPPEFVLKWVDYYHALIRHGVNWNATAIGIGGIVVIALLRRFAPGIPGAIVAVVLAGAAVAVFHLDDKARFADQAVATIGSKFGGIPQSLPRPTCEFARSISYQKVRELIPEATTIAMLAAIESLLCCVVADGMIGGRHKSNVELVAQGVGNIASIFFGGIPATGAIARTAANIKSGGRTPLAGMIHALFVLVCMLLLAPLAVKIPMAVFASVLVVVAWNMSERDHFKTLFRAPRSDIAVLLTTFGLTVLTDLTIAVGVGMILAAMLFMKRMSEVTNVAAIREEIEESGPEFPDLVDPNSIAKRDVPPGVEVYEINGPFFFGVADRLKDTLRGLERPPRVFILRMRRVSAIDATGMHALDEFHLKCRKQGTTLLLAGVHAQPIFAMTRYGLIDKIGEQNLFGNIDDALNRARQIVGQQPQPRPPTAVPEVARERT